MSEQQAQADIPGIDVAGVTAWYEANIPGTQGPLDFLLVAGGRSNLTFKVTDAGGRATVLRRPPTGHVLPTAHDMAREHRIISALAPTAVPVAPALGLCTDPAVNGAPFYVMDHVDGLILRDRPTAEEAVDEAARRRASEGLIDTLADLHAVDPAAVGLGDLGRTEGYIARQLKRWYSQFQASTAETGRTVSVIDEVHDALAARIPEQGPAAIVHGDYRLDNTMFDADGNVLAVLDWEICTLGDPLADMGLLMVYWSEDGDQNMPLGVAPTALPGFLTRQALCERYADRTGRDLSDLGFYTAFGYWKLACILEGVYTRYAGGSGGGDAGGFEGFAQQVGVLGEAARAAL